MFDGIGRNVGWKFQPSEKVIQHSYHASCSLYHSFILFFPNGGVQGCSCDGLNRASRFRWWKTSSRESKRMDQKEDRKWLLPKQIPGVKRWISNGLQRYVLHECHWQWVLIKSNFGPLVIFYKSIRIGIRTFKNPKINIVWSRILGIFHFFLLTFLWKR